MELYLIELTIVWVLIAWIMIATVKGLKKVAPVEAVKQTDLMKGLWKLEIALGLALCGLAGLGTITAIFFPYNFGIGVLLVTSGVFMLTYQATKDLEKVPIIASYTEKIEAWAAKVKEQKKKKR
ncbi:MAG: hypothetical protein Q8O03_03330 [Nanoarchaeota archaeon]|nr:hypothetical protein [Nanoarchaeota archaeon]